MPFEGGYIGMNKLTGEQRLQIIVQWIKRGKEMEKEAFVKKVCEAKNIEYVLPVKLKNGR